MRWEDAMSTVAPGPYLTIFCNGYIDAMLWANLSTADGETYEHPGGEFNSHPLRAVVSPEAFAEMYLDCLNFVSQEWEDLHDLRPEQCGHDFALTRNGHGAGFWDRGYGDVGECLTRACKPYGDAGLIHTGTTIEVL
jgi:hypothetical protein